MWHSEVQLSFISNHNGEAEFHLYLTDQGNISNLLSITLWDFKWRRTEEKPNRLSHLHFLSNVGRKPWNSTACQQEGRESGIWFPSCFLCLGSPQAEATWPLRGPRSPIILWFPPLRFLQRTLGKASPLTTAATHTRAHFWFPAQCSQTQSVDDWAIPGASCSCHKHDWHGHSLFLALKRKC